MTLSGIQAFGDGYGSYLNKTRFPLKSVAGRAPGRAIGRSAGADGFAEAKMTKMEFCRRLDG
jgi:hypothetical protein